jgi:hypothetical protein
VIHGKPEVFEKAHYEKHAGFAPPYLCELVVHCLEMVSHLAAREFPFRFKGGNSQLILLDEPQRFSIDVDIVSTVSKDDMTAHVEAVTAACDRFTRCEVRPHKTKPWLPMISYKLFFESFFQEPEESFVMLDAVLEPAPYGGTRKPVVCGELYQSEQTVDLPTISGLLADKLLCIGPATLGIPLGKKKEAQRLKHVFDVANLSRHEHDRAEVESALLACMAQENELQKSDWNRQQVFEDTREFASQALAHPAPPPPSELEPGTYLDEIARGFGEFRTFLFRVDYTWERFQEDCRRVAGVLDELTNP